MAHQTSKNQKMLSTEKIMTGCSQRSRKIKKMQIHYPPNREKHLIQIATTEFQGEQVSNTQKNLKNGYLTPNFGGRSLTHVTLEPINLSWSYSSPPRDIFSEAPTTFGCELRASKQGDFHTFDPQRFYLWGYYPFAKFDVSKIVGIESVRGTQILLPPLLSIPTTPQKLKNGHLSQNLLWAELSTRDYETKKLKLRICGPIQKHFQTLTASGFELFDRKVDLLFALEPIQRPLTTRYRTDLKFAVMNAIRGVRLPHLSASPSKIKNLIFDLVYKPIKAFIRTHAISRAPVIHGAFMEHSFAKVS